MQTAKEKNAEVVLAQPEDGCSSANTLKIVRDILVTMYFISMGRWPHAKSAKLESALPKQGL